MLIFMQYVKIWKKQFITRGLAMSIVTYTFLNMNDSDVMYRDSRKTYTYVSDSPYAGEDKISVEYRYDDTTHRILFSGSSTISGDLQFSEGSVSGGIVSSFVRNQYHEPYTHNTPTFRSMVSISEIFKPFTTLLSKGALSADVYKWALSGDDMILEVGWGSSGDTIYSYGGNDYISPSFGDDFVDGGIGVDSVAYQGKAAEYTITHQSLNKATFA